MDGPEFYVPTVFDRGHMVRRLDPVWGTEGPARLANADTHHYTNSCPQVHRTLETEKRALPSMFAPVILQKATGSAHDDAEVLVLKLKWPLLPRTLDLNQIALVLW